MKALLLLLKLPINPIVLSTSNIPILVISTINLLMLRVVELYLPRIYRLRLALLIARLVRLLILRRIVIKYIIYSKLFDIYIPSIIFLLLILFVLTAPKPAIPLSLL